MPSPKQPRFTLVLDDDEVDFFPNDDNILSSGSRKGFEEIVSATISAQTIHLWKVLISSLGMTRINQFNKIRTLEGGASSDQGLMIRK